MCSGTKETLRSEHAARADDDGDEDMDALATAVAAVKFGYDDEDD